ncbi:unnamed protein product [Fraxinus pennsylvanica]|uniref:RING-type E3 ubiquitin transferase n=1 Tax=Fraxinus pennsylvanica TaxID=56036 RepID=A0AAD2EDN9_9LAMI|nr:unnamed protein product [Fraxinus pennsylvanica]
MADASSLIPTTVLHDLSHKLYEKRKKAALESLPNSPQTNHRKGGLIALAAATVGLASEAAQHLERYVNVDLLLAFLGCSFFTAWYEDAVAIQALPCTHHFHTSCIVKWLKVKALCLICKYDIHKGKDHE